MKKGKEMKKRVKEQKKTDKERHAKKNTNKD